jgi:hypothetical protein
VQSGQLRLVDNQVRPLQQAGMGTNGGNQGFEINATFQNHLANTGPQPSEPSPPLKLQWDIPTGIKEINVPFEFKDVPLP